MSVIKNTSSERLIAIGFTATLLVLLAVGVIALLRADSDNRAAVFILASIGLLLCFLGGLLLLAKRQVHLAAAREAAMPAVPLLKAGALQDAIFNSVNFSSIATDAQGVIQIFNVGAERMLGYRAADVVDKLTPADISDAQELIVRAGALSDEFTTAIAPGFEALVYKAMRGIEDIYDLTYIRADGTRLPALVSVTALHGPDGRLIGFLLIGTDNTARKQVEAEQALLDQRLRETNAELQAAREAAEKANRAKSEFLSSMSHELRTPLNAVLGFAQLMASEVPTPPARQQRSIDQILKGGWYLLRLINEILDLATIESGKVTMSQEPMSMTDVLQDCKGMIEPQAAKRGIAMTFPRFDTVFYIHADRTRVKQVMINLLSNAIKYNASGGSVIVQCVATDAGRVRIRVKDTGTGLSADQMAQLFQPFNRLGQQDGAEEGTGIGLVVTKQLVELMGGTIGVESAVGVGTVFWVEFESAQAPALENIEEAALDRRPLAAPEASEQLTLLYVEDNPANLALVEQLIARRGDLKLVTAIDAYLGIELARAYVPDVILMDINLPGMSGYGALKVLRDDPLTAHIPVLALSANAVPRDIEKGIEAGFFRYLTKPIRVREFMDALDVALHHAAENDSGRPARLASPVSQQSEESPC
jgi:signal transduction histidine kinase/ActR/RegA family two-component response regulator